MLRMDLSGEWDLRLDETKRGIGQHFERCAFPDSILLPGTTSVAAKGMGNLERETGFLTESYPYTGYAWFQRSVTLPFRSELELSGKRFILRLERTRLSSVWVDGEFVGSGSSLTAPHTFDITAYIHTLCPGITIMVSNTDYPAKGGHLTSPDTQTNWNGVLGEISLEITEGVRIRTMRAIPHPREGVADLAVRLELAGEDPAKEVICRVTGDLCRLKDAYLEKDADLSAWEKPLPDGRTVPERTEFVRKSAGSTSFEELAPFLEIEEGAIPEIAETADLTAEPPAGSERDLRRFRIRVPLRRAGEEAALWDEDHPYVYRIRLELLRPKDGILLDEQTVWTGLRDLHTEDGAFYVGDRRVFLRGKHDGMIFPVTGFAPMDVFSWLRHFRIAKDWGMNHVRFHTCTPPDAAFLAADLLGLYLQPELELWGNWNGPEDEGFDAPMQEYLTKEGWKILESFSSHPSFCMMSMGNELWGNPEELGRLVAGYKKKYPWILFTQGSNNFQWVPNIQESDDFFSGVRLAGDRLIRGSYAMCDAPQGHIQTKKPCTNHFYDDLIRPRRSDGAEQEAALQEVREASAQETGHTEEPADPCTVEIQYGTGVKTVSLTEGQQLIPKIPVVSHEIGQYETYPDYDEIGKYTGALKARNLETFRERLWNAGLYDLARAYFECSGALALDCYKRELEAAVCSEELAGFQLLDLQDFSGQGTALVGMLDAFMDNKGITKPDYWRGFCDDITVHAHFSSYVLTAGRPLRTSLTLCYFRGGVIRGAQLAVRLTDLATGENLFAKRAKLPALKECGRTRLPFPEIPVPASKSPACYELSLEILLPGAEGEEDALITRNSYELWAYPGMEHEEREIGRITEIAEEDPMQRRKNGDVPIALSARKAVYYAQKPGSVLLYLHPDKNPRSVEGTYCTDFWCYPMFRSISESMGKPVPVGTMGLLIQNAHPALKGFPSRPWSTPQWFEPVMHSRSTILDGLPVRPIVQTIDNFERNHLLGLIYELRIAGLPGRILVCCADLPGLIREGCSEALALHRSLLTYLSGFSTFRPDTDPNICELRAEDFLALFA